MTQPDLVKSTFPAIAALRDKWGMWTASSEHAGIHWVVRMEGDSFDLVINKDRGDDSFHIRLHGSNQAWDIPTILHEMGLWGDLRERVDHRKLARVLEPNIVAVLRHIAAGGSGS